MRSFRFLSASFIMCLVSALLIFAQAHARTIKSLERTNAPLAIIKIKAAGREASFDQPFNAEAADWFRDLSVTVKNNSQQPVSFIDVQLIFQGSEKDSIPTLEHLFYGCDLSLNRATISNCRAAPLKPGESTTLTLADYRDTRNYLTRTGKPPNINDFALRIGTVFFADETMWAHGTIYMRAPDNPRKWIPKNKSGS